MTCACSYFRKSVSLFLQLIGDFGEIAETGERSAHGCGEPLRKSVKSVER